MGTRRRPLGRSYSGNGRFSAYSPGQGSDGEENGPLVESRPERRSYLLSVRPENRSTFCTIIAQLTEETQPLFETTLKSYAVSEEADAKFTCIVTGYPQPEVTWYKDDEEMDRYCGLPKYEIFRHGNRHTLQLYKCREEDAAIYQASARNSKGIVSCSGVLEVGTMTEYKIHQRWFAKLKRKAEAKLWEIEQSRKRGKENVEVEQLRRVSPDRFQRKRRLTGEVGMRSGASLWDKEEVAKVHIPDGKPRFSEEDPSKSKEPPLNAATLFTNNFITGGLEAEVTTNGDSSLESSEENGEENANGFLTYIYETVEIMRTKPATKEFSAKKKKKEEETASLPNADRDIFRQEDGTQWRSTASLATNEQQMDTGPREVPSRVAEKHMSLPHLTPSKADVYFSLKDMYFDIGVNPESEQKSAEEKTDAADTTQSAVDASSLEEWLPAARMPLKRAKPEDVQHERYTEQEVEESSCAETQRAKTAAIETAGDSNATQFQYPNWTPEPTSEVQHSIWVGNAAEVPDKSILGAGVQPPSCTSETDAGVQPSLSGEIERVVLDRNIRETVLLDSFVSDVEPAMQLQTRNVAEPRVDPSLFSPEPTEDLQPASLGEQLHSEGPCEAPGRWKPVLSTAHNNLQPSDSGLGEETNQEADYLTIREDALVETETDWSEKRASPGPETQESSALVIQEGNQRPPVTSQTPPVVSFGTTEPIGEEHLFVTENVRRLSPRFDSDEVQHRETPSPGSKEVAAPKSERTSPEMGPSACLDQGAPQTEAVAREKPLELLRDNRLGLNMDVELEPERMPIVTARPLLLPEGAVKTPVPYQSVLEKPHPLSGVMEPQVCHESQEPPLLLSPVTEDLLAERNQSVAHLLKDVKREMDAWQPTRPAASEPEQQADSIVEEEEEEEEEEEGPAKEESATVLRGEGDEEGGLTPGKKLEPRAREKGRGPSHVALGQDLPQPESAMEEGGSMDKAQHTNLVSSLKNYLLLLLKITTESDKSKGSPKQEVKAAEQRGLLSAIPRHVPDVGIAGLTPRTSRKIFEQVETNQLFQSAESLQLTPKTSRRITGMINHELLACKESLGAEPEATSLPCVPSIVVGSVSGEPSGLPDLSPEISGELPAALPSATPQELALGARRKIYLPKTKQADETEGAATESQPHSRRDSPTVSPQQSRRSATLLQTHSPVPSPPMERRSPTLARKMATLEVPKIYEEPAEESKSVADVSQGTPESLEETEGQMEESWKANDPFKAPQVIRKIRAEQFSDASGNLKLWCQFFNILSDSKLTWYKDEIPVTDARRSSGDEGQAALAIVQVSLKDCGVYQCTIQNEYGTDSTDFLLSAEVLSGFISKEEIEVGEEIEMTPMVFAKGLADSGFWGDKLFGRIMLKDLEVGQGFRRKACRARAIYGLEPVFESGHTGIIKVRNLIAFGGRSESTLVERNYDITIQECKIQNSSREYCKIFAAEARAVPAFGPVPEIIPLYLIYRPANNIPYATMEEDLPGPLERYCGRVQDGSLTPPSASEVGHKCCTFQHWLYQWTNGNILVTDLEGVGWKITNVRIATKTKGYQGLKENCCPGLLEHFVASHQCNRYCELLALKSLEIPQPPAKSKGSRSPITGRKTSSTQSSPQLQKKGLASPQAPRRGSVSPKSARKCSEAAETQLAARPKAGDSGKAGRLQ